MAVFRSIIIDRKERNKLGIELPKTIAPHIASPDVIIDDDEQ